MARFVNDQQTTDKEVKRLFSAGVLLLLGKAYSDAYSCFDRIHEEHFEAMYNKALCCFMVNGMTNVTDCFVRRNDSCMEWILHTKRSCPKLFSATIMMKISLLSHSARYSSVRGIQTIASVESGNGFPAAFI